MTSHMMLSAVLAKKAALSTAVGVSLLVAVAVDPTILAAAVVTIITALTGSVVIIINALSGAKKELLAVSERVSSQAAVIQGHVDGMTTAAAAKRTADEDTITSLRDQLVKSENRAASLAQATAATAAVVASQAPPISMPSRPAGATPTAGESLHQIDTNTAQIEKNTAKTDAAVQTLKDKP